MGDSVLSSKTAKFLSAVLTAVAIVGLLAIFSWPLLVARKQVNQLQKVDDEARP